LRMPPKPPSAALRAASVASGSHCTMICRPPWKGVAADRESAGGAGATGDRASAGGAGAADSPSLTPACPPAVGVGTERSVSTDSSAPANTGLRATGLRADAGLWADAVGKLEAAGSAGVWPGSAVPEMAWSSAPIGLGAWDAEAWPAGASSKYEFNVNIVGRPGTFERSLGMVEVERIMKRKW
jgi:hypothetical protein